MFFKKCKRRPLVYANNVFKINIIINKKDQIVFYPTFKLQENQLKMTQVPPIHYFFFLLLKVCLFLEYALKIKKTELILNIPLTFLAFNDR